MKLSIRLKHASHDLHGVAEKSGLMADLLHDRLSLRDYTVLLQNLQAIYAVLEGGLPPQIDRQELDFRPLYRSAAIAQDLAYLKPESDAKLCEASGRYVARLEELSASDSLLLLAHAYVRYLGDLHGGQLLRRCVMRLLKTDGVKGLDFYDFGVWPSFGSAGRSRRLRGVSRFYRDQHRTYLCDG